MVDMNRYIGIPYEKGGISFKGADCFGLLRLFYEEEYGIRLPFFEDGDAIMIKEIDVPVDHALIRCVSLTNAADHWGMYVGGKVLNAQKPHSAMIDFKKFVSMYPVIEIYEVL